MSPFSALITTDPNELDRFRDRFVVVGVAQALESQRPFEGRQSFRGVGANLAQDVCRALAQAVVLRGQQACQRAHGLLPGGAQASEELGG
jgi:hypothetical protein